MCINCSSQASHCSHCPSPLPFAHVGISTRPSPKTLPIVTRSETSTASYPPLPFDLLLISTA